MIVKTHPRNKNHKQNLQIPMMLPSNCGHPMPCHDAPRQHTSSAMGTAGEVLSEHAQLAADHLALAAEALHQQLLGHRTHGMAVMRKSRLSS